MWSSRYAPFIKYITSQHKVLILKPGYFTLLFDTCFSEGKRHDSGMLADSGLLQDLEAYAFSPAGLPMSIYGDPAYPLRIHLQGPFRSPHLTPLMEAFNASMSSVRISVEWLFGDIINYFKFLDFKKNLKIGMSSIGKMAIACALLHNAHTRLYGSKNSKCFELEPPTLEEYFAQR